MARLNRQSSLFTLPQPGLPLRTRLAERVREALRAEIRNRRWEKTLPSERHLSQEFQVGRPTVHLALCSLEREGLVRGGPGQPWEVVHRAAPPRRGRQRRAEVVVLRNARAKPDLTSLLPLIDNLRQKLHRIGFDLAVVDALMHGAKRLDETLSDIDAEHQASFYLLLSVPPDVHRWFQGKDVPALIFGSRPPDVRLPAVDFNPVTTMQHAVEYLFRNGHRHVGLLLPTVTCVGEESLRQSFQDGCERHASAGMQGIIETTVARPAAVKTAVRRFFTRPRLPTAIIAPDLELMIGLYATLGELGRVIPRKVSVLSTGSWPILDYLTPLPTCYKLPWDKAANHAIRVISDYLRLGVWPNTFCNLLPTLRAGESVATL